MVALSKLALGAVARKRNRSRRMTAILIEEREGIFTGLPGDGDARAGRDPHRDGASRRSAILRPEPGEHVIDAAGCVIYPGLDLDPPPPVPEHPQGRALRHQPAADGLAALGAATPTGARSTRRRSTSPPGSASSNCCCPAPPRRPTTTICSATPSGSIRPHVIFEVARDLGHPAGVLPRRRHRVAHLRHRRLQADADRAARRT